MASIKTTNAVISYLLEFGSSPRIDIARALSLTKASVTLVTNDMLDKGIIVEQGEIFDEKNKTIRGRRKILLSINPDYKVTIGIAVLTDKILIGITNLKGDIFAKKIIPFNLISYSDILNLILQEVDLLLKDNLINIEDILAAGVVCSTSFSNLIAGDSFEQKTEVLKSDLSSKVSYQIVVGSIAKSSLMAQRVFGEISNPSSTIMITLVEDLDVGLCINSTLFKGRDNWAGGRLILEKSINKYNADKDIEKLTDAISLCLSVLDLHNVYAFGSIFSNIAVIEKINNKILTETKINPPTMNEETLFLSGCGQALFECLVFD